MMCGVSQLEFVSYIVTVITKSTFSAEGLNTATLSNVERILFIANLTPHLNACEFFFGW